MKPSRFLKRHHTESVCQMLLLRINVKEVIIIMTCIFWQFTIFKSFMYSLSHLLVTICIDKERIFYSHFILEKIDQRILIRSVSTVIFINGIDKGPSILGLVNCKIVF